MNMLGKYGNIIIGAIVVVAAFFIYTYFFTSPATPALSATSAQSATAVSDQDLIVLLSTLHTIKLDDSIFSDPTFQSLTDFSTALVPEPVGRTDPFSPLSGSASAPAQTGTVGH